MNRPNLPTHPNPSQFAQHVEQLRSRLADIHNRIPPETLAERTGSRLTTENQKSGKYIFILLDQEVNLLYPEWIVKDARTSTELPITSQALVLFYFITADGATPDGNWISFSDLPDGRFYSQAYQGYTGAVLANAFNNDLASFGQAASRLGGVDWSAMPEVPGDAAYRFQVLPHLAALATCWEGDEDFPTSYQILFENTAAHYMPTDVCAYLGSFLTRSLIKAKSA